MPKKVAQVSAGSLQDTHTGQNKRAWLSQTDVPMVVRMRLRILFQKKLSFRSNQLHETLFHK